MYKRSCSTIYDLWHVDHPGFPQLLAFDHVSPASCWRCPIWCNASYTGKSWYNYYIYIYIYIYTFIICQMFIAQAHWSIPSHMTICNQAYFLPKTILIGQNYSILFSVMVLLLWHHIVLLWRHIVLLWHHIVLLFDRNVTQVILWYLTSQYDVTIVAPCPTL